MTDDVSVDLSEDSVRALQAAARMARRAGSLPAAHYPALSEALSKLDGAVPRRSAIVEEGETADDLVRAFEAGEPVEVDNRRGGVTGGSIGWRDQTVRNLRH